MNKPTLPQAYLSLYGKQQPAVISDLEYHHGAITGKIRREWQSALDGYQTWDYLTGFLDGLYVAGNWQHEHGTGSELLLLASMAAQFAQEVQK